MWLVTLLIPIGFWLRRKRISILGLVIGLVGLLGSSLLGGVMTGGDWIVTGLGPMLGLIGGIWAGRALSPVLRGVEGHAR